MLCIKLILNGFGDGCAIIYNYERRAGVYSEAQVYLQAPVQQVRLGEPQQQGDSELRANRLLQLWVQRGHDEHLWEAGKEIHRGAGSP